MNVPITAKEGDYIGSWKLHRKIGSGCYGAVFSATCSEFGSTKYAIKIAPFNKNKKKNQAAFMINHEKNYYKIRFNAFRVDHDEIPHFPRCSNPNSTLISGTTEDQKYTYLVMEEFPLGLSEYVRNHGGKLSKCLCYIVAASMIQIIKFCHSKCVIVNDIKVDNFMLRATSNGYQLVIIDFGAAEPKAKNKVIHAEGPRGTPLFTSINSDRQGDMYFSDDLSAVSYVICKLLLGFLPWEECESCEEILQMKCSTVLEDSLKNCPELLQFVTSFKEKKTDSINYDDWINLFSSKAAALDPKGMNLHYIPVQDQFTTGRTPSPPHNPKRSEEEDSSLAEEDQCEYGEKRRKVSSHQLKTPISKSTKSTNSQNQSRRKDNSKQSLEIVDLCESSSGDDEFIMSKQPPRTGKCAYKRH